MTTTAAPFGLMPVKHASGQIRYETARIAAAYASAIYQYSPVKMLADGTIGVAAAGDEIVGVLIGVEYVDATGKPCTGHWPAGQTLMTGTEAIATITRDPGIIYRVQATATLGLTNIGNMLDLAAAGTGDNVMGTSKASADAATVGTTSAQLQILGFLEGPTNVIGDAFPIILVRIAEHQLVYDPSAGTYAAQAGV